MSDNFFLSDWERKKRFEFAEERSTAWFRYFVFSQSLTTPSLKYGQTNLNYSNCISAFTKLVMFFMESRVKETTKALLPFVSGAGFPNTVLELCGLSRTRIFRPKNLWKCWTKHFYRQLGSGLVLIQ